MISGWHALAVIIAVTYFLALAVLRWQLDFFELVAVMIVVFVLSVMGGKKPKARRRKKADGGE